LSDLVDIEDLGLLDGKDLIAVLDQASPEEVVLALIGIPAGRRRHLLTKLPAASAAEMEARLDAVGPVPFEAAHNAQRALVEALCRLGRGGQIAFDDPEDMVA